ncbi:DUF935 domain-containing protein [Spongiibacter sp. UBA1325]|uniref:DUF935 domain-containing protein n=1 Tax=Spongiibacter sp. UBA1325 TaxID=1947543 RepID=UPI00257D4BC2|nr:DUF935 domain-containing protein [Spongiibacter sp. UBA1325]|tara:strand:- start:10409 stop:12016 length:1608 start_codon:yes stop_codon:yes gene_type:complete
MAKKKRKSKKGIDTRSPALHDTQVAASAGNAQSAQLMREFAEHPSKGLTPARLYQILEGAEQGNLKAQSELFDDMEEKDPQIGSDMAKRRQLAAELEWQIKPPEGASRKEKMAAEQAAEAFDGLEVEDLIIDLGAGLGHGWANLELSWAQDNSLRFIEQPTLQPHSWFRLHPDDQHTITLRDNSNTGAELWPLGWAQHRHRAKPGYVARSGLCRMLAWPYLFQNYALGDLAQLLEIYGMPARVGQYPKNASDAEKATLLRAVVSLGSNAAGIIPDGMKIDYLNAASGDEGVFESMINWCERAKARVILGGTLTSGTGEGTNTNALGNVHERSLMSLLRSDVRQYASTIKRDILWPMAAMNYGVDDLRRAPVFFLDTSEPEDYETLANSLPVMVNMGMRIPMWWAHEKSGIPQASKQEDILQSPTAAPAPAPAPAAAPNTDNAALRANLAALKSAPPATDATNAQLNRLQTDGDLAIEGWVEKIRTAVEQAQSLEALQVTLLQQLPNLSTEQFAQAMGDALAAAQLAGRYDILEGV